VDHHCRCQGGGDDEGAAAVVAGGGAAGLHAEVRQQSCRLRIHLQVLLFLREPLSVGAPCVPAALA